MENYLDFDRVKSTIRLEHSEDRNGQPRVLFTCSSEDIGTVSFSLNPEEVESMIKWLAGWQRA